MVTRLADRQARRTAIERALQRPDEAPRIDLVELETRMSAKLADWSRLLRKNVAEARAVLRALLVGPLRFMPIRDERRCGYAFSGTIDLDRLLSGVVNLPTMVASPTGFEPVF